MSRMQVNFHLFADDIERAATFYQEYFRFSIEGQLNETWGALRSENAVIWLGVDGAKRGLVILIDEGIEECINDLKRSAIEVFIPEEHQNEQKHDIIDTEWGRHFWFRDTENNTVMVFQPAFG